jgi:hypothetical protein
MATSILHSQNFRFQITIYPEGNWDFLALNWVQILFTKNILEANENELRYLIHNDHILYLVNGLWYVCKHGIILKIKFIK